MTNVEEVILRAAEILKPKGALIPFTDLYKAVSYSKEAINKGLLSLEEKGLIYFNRDNRAHLLKPAQRAKLLKRGEDYYIGFAVRNPMRRSTTKKKPTPAQLRARARFAAAAKKRSVLARKRNKTIIKAKRVKIVSANPSPEDIALLKGKLKQSKTRHDRLQKEWREALTALNIEGDRQRGLSGEALKESQARYKELNRNFENIGKLRGSAIEEYESLLNEYDKVKGRRNPISGFVIQFVRDAIKEGRTLAQMQEVMRNARFSEKEIKDASNYFKAESGVTEAQKEKRVKKLYQRNPVSGDRARLKSVLLLLRRLKARAARATGVQRSLLRKQIIELQGERFTLEQRVKGLARSRNPKVTPKSRSNFERFHGRPSRKTLSLLAPKGTPKSLSINGPLKLIKTSRAVLRFDKIRRNPESEVYLAESDNGKLHIVAEGSVLPTSEHTNTDFGAIQQVEYYADKPHLGYPGTTEFYHKMGEETGVKPHLVTNDQGEYLIQGGEYFITERGIENPTRRRRRRRF